MCLSSRQKKVANSIENQGLDHQHEINIQHNTLPNSKMSSNKYWLNGKLDQNINGSKSVSIFLIDF